MYIVHAYVHVIRYVWGVGVGLCVHVSAQEAKVGHLATSQIYLGLSMPFIVSCKVRLVMIGNFNNFRKSTSMVYPSLSLILPDAPGICIGDFAVSQSPSFNVYFDNIQTDDVVQEYRGVVGQDGELVLLDEFVEMLYIP